jgi:hypothetical protein
VADHLQDISDLEQQTIASKILVHYSPLVEAVHTHKMDAHVLLLLLLLQAGQDTLMKNTCTAVATCIALLAL